MDEFYGLHIVKTKTFVEDMMGQFSRNGAILAFLRVAETITNSATVDAFF